MKKIILILPILFSLSLFFSCGTTENVEKPVESEEVKVPEAINDEYLRSTKSLGEEKVTVEEFEEDKAAILRIIEELSVIMNNGDKGLWLTYIDPESQVYYSNTTNLRKVREKLPNKQIQLHGIGDYFKYVFIPSRKNSQIDEIRYISRNNIKAVQVKDDGYELIYYYFVKKDGKWYVHIPTLDEQ